MKKVLLATRPLVPPWDEASKNFAYFLGKEVKDHTLTLLTTDRKLPELPPTTLQEPLYKSRDFGFNEKSALLEYLRKMRGNFDITHYLFTPTLFNSRLIRFFAKPTRGHTIQTVATIRRDLYSGKELSELLFADQIVVYTERSKRLLEELGKKNVARIYPGIDLQKYTPQPKFPALLSSFGLDESHFVVMYPGEYTRLGATDMLTETFIQFFRDNPTTNLRFLFACRVKNREDEKKKEKVRNKFEDAGVLPYIAFTDTIADMPSLYNLADVVIFPVENLKGKFDVPLVILEAYACGKPVILSDLPEFEEFTGPEFSVIIPKSNGGALLESLAYLKDNKSAVISFGNNARRFVEDNFDLKKTALSYSALYDSF